MINQKLQLPYLLWLKLTHVLRRIITLDSSSSLYLSYNISC
jgi:hypothetical protein